MNRLATTKILHGYRYVSAYQVARQIKSVPRICNTAPYLDCLVEYHDVLTLCQKFADAVGDQDIRDPDVFVTKLRACDPDTDTP